MCGLARSRCGWGSGSLWVLDALRCILSLTWALNELFQMKILPVLRKQSTFFILSWCAGLSACGTMPLRLGVWGRLKAPRSQRVLDALRCILSLIWDPFFWCAGLSGRSPIIFFHGVRAQLFFSLIIRAQFSFFKEFQGTIIIFNSIHVPPPLPPEFLMVNS